MTPGSQLHRVARLVCGAVTCQRVVEPLLADLQREWRDTPPGVRRVLLLAGGYAAFWQTCAICSIRALALEAVRAPGRETRWSAVVALTVSAIGLVLLQALAVGFELQGAVGQASVVWWWMVFNTATTTMPLALLPACLRARNRGARGADVAKLAIAGALLTIVMASWVAPWAERHHIAAVVQHQDQVDAATAARSHGHRYAWAVVPRPGYVPQGRPAWPATVAGRGVLALAVAWMGWSVARPREQHLAAVIGWWVVIGLALNVHQAAEPAFRIWQQAMGLVMITVAVRQHSRVAARSVRHRTSL